MLVLIRKLGESIVLKLPSGEEIKITLSAVKGLQARIGIEAPEKVGIVKGGNN